MNSDLALYEIELRCRREESRFGGIISALAFTIVPL